MFVKCIWRLVLFSWLQFNHTSHDLYKSAYFIIENTTQFNLQFFISCYMYFNAIPLEYVQKRWNCMK